MQLPWACLTRLGIDDVYFSWNCRGKLRENSKCQPYKSDGTHNVTRPINTNLMLSEADTSLLASEFPRILRDPQSVRKDVVMRRLIRDGIYTIQQSIGATLDALPAKRSNTARNLTPNT